jgi:hypothetical protein
MAATRTQQRRGTPAATWHEPMLAPFILLAILTTHFNGYEFITSAVSAEARFGSALRELRIAPVTNLDRLIDLGSRDAMKISKKVPEGGEKVEKDGVFFRHYEYRGLGLTTQAVEVETTFIAVIEAPH